MIGYWHDNVVCPSVRPSTSSFLIKAVFRPSSRNCCARP